MASETDTALAHSNVFEKASVGDALHEGGSGDAVRKLRRYVAPNRRSGHTCTEHGAICG